MAFTYALIQPNVRNTILYFIELICGYRVYFEWFGFNWLYQIIFETRHLGAST